MIGDERVAQRRVLAPYGCLRRVWEYVLRCGDVMQSTEPRCQHISGRWRHGTAYHRPVWRRR
jgi:hypothetical protein